MGPFHSLNWSLPDMLEWIQTGGVAAIAVGMFRRGKQAQKVDDTIERAAKLEQQVTTLARVCEVHEERFKHIFDHITSTNSARQEMQLALANLATVMAHSPAVRPNSRS